MPAGWVAGGAAIAGVIGSQMQSDATRSAANTSADAQRYAANQAADAAKFRPVGITSNFGSSNFTIDPNTGYVTGAGYSLDPRLQNIQSGLFNTMSGYDPSKYQAASNDVFNLGRSYLGADPAAISRDYYNQQRQLLMPGREQQQADVQNAQFQAGRSGFGIGGTKSGYTVGGPGLFQTNPQLAAMYNANAQQDAALAAQSDQYARDRATYGLNLMNTSSGLFNSGYAPLSTILGLSSNIEQLGANTLDVGSQIGGRSATAGANVGQDLLYGGINAARTQQLGNQQSFGGNVLTGASQSLNTAAAPAMQDWFKTLIKGNQNTFNTDTNNWFTSPSSAGTFSGNAFQLQTQ